MVYGNKLVYVYEEDTVDEEGKGKVVNKKLDLTFNPMTFIKYQNYTGRDFMADFMEISFNMSNKISPELLKKIENDEEILYGDISNSDIEALTGEQMTKNIEFFINAVASMIATSVYPKNLDFGEIINTLPIFLFYDDNFLKELVEFITFGLKKNKQTITRTLSKIKLN